jgi:hypothetical protein
MGYTKDKTELVAFRLNKRDRSELRRLARQRKVSESDLIRYALLLYKEKGPAELEARNGAGSTE